MALLNSITLKGDNLGARHRFLNSLVKDAYSQDALLHFLQDLPEQSPVDRIFKIDLASKHRNMDFILQTLKNEDMLYVRRALKCTWILEPQYSYIINPTFLEETLFPEMLFTAVNLFIHFIHLHLKDPSRCEEFYNYYDKKNFKIAFKFLRHCSIEFLLKKIAIIMDKITPQNLKDLSEKSPMVAKIYFDNLQDNKIALDNYLNNDSKYYESLKNILKVNAVIFFDIIEKYFNPSAFSRLSRTATIYIMKNHKDRFIKKPELYTAWLLNMETLGNSLKNEEIKNIVLQLARAAYLSHWFSYKNIEPLLKCLSTEERTALKKKVFIDKSIGDKIQNWPYPPPTRLEAKVIDDSHVFVDIDYKILENMDFRCHLKKRKYAKWCVGGKMKTLLDELFDRYRFVGFERTLYELSKQIKAESSVQNREYILLVLVSKSGGRAESLVRLLLLLAKHSNEPSTVRAAVVRSLVRRAAVWRLSIDLWGQLLKFAHHLGLDGEEPDAACHEGLHAAVLRHILQDTVCTTKLWTTFLQQFSSFSEYSLNAEERRQVRQRLPAMLLAAASDSEPCIAAERLNQLLDTLSAFKLPISECDGAVSAIATLSHRDATVARPLLQRLYDARVARRELVKENFSFLQTDKSYLNALRHNAELLVNGKDFKNLLEQKQLNHERFLRKLMVYFGENDGLANSYFKILEHQIQKSPDVSLARSIALLAGIAFQTHLNAFHGPKKSMQARFAAALRANAHLARPPLDLEAMDVREVGAKAIANRVLVCSSKNKDRHINNLLVWSRTLRLALILAQSTVSQATVFKTMAIKRPGAALKAMLRYLQKPEGEHRSEVWDCAKTLINKLDLSLKQRFRLLHSLENANVMSNIQAEYCVTIYYAFRKISKEKAMLILCRMEAHLPGVEESFFYNILNEFINDFDFTGEKYQFDPIIQNYARLYVRIITKFLLLCRCPVSQDHRYQTVGKPFLDHLVSLWDTARKQSEVKELFDELIFSLKYTTPFIDSSFVTCIPVFEKILKRIQMILPVGRWFHKYVEIHLTMLYYRSIRQIIKQKPEALANVVAKQNEGVELVGTVFGKYIAHDIDGLVAEYFPSIKVLYAEGLAKFFMNYFKDGTSRCKLVRAVIRSILKRNNVNSLIVAECLFAKERTNLGLIEDILKSFMEIENNELKFFLNAHSTKI